MNRRYIILSGLCVLAAVAAGCTPLSGSRPDAPVPPPLGKIRPANDTSAGYGEVVQAGGTQPADPNGKFDARGAQPGGTAQAPPAGQPLPAPRPGGPMVLPPLPPGVLNGPPGTGYPATGYPAVGAPSAGNPHVLPRPTVSGKTLELGPHEMPTDRVLELARHLEALLAQNRDLVARIQELERLGAGREQALIEAIREVEAAENEVAKTRGIILTQKSELASLQDKIRQMEREDIDLLKLVIAALEKLLPSPRREP